MERIRVGRAKSFWTSNMVVERLFGFLSINLFIVAWLLCFSGTLHAKTLTIQFTGAGNGSVNSAPPGIACTRNPCFCNFSAGKSVKLIPNPDSSSKFAGWNGEGCSGTGNCSLTLDYDTTITASYGLIPRIVKIGNQTYDSLLAAYSSAVNGSTLQMLGMVYNEGLQLNQGINVLITGGYNADFTSRDNFTYLNQPVVIRLGSLTVNGLAIAAARPNVIVPDVVGKKQTDATAAMTYHGLLVGTVSSVYSDSITAGAIVDQSPLAELSVPRGTTVSLSVSLGPEMKIESIDPSEGASGTLIHIRGVGFKPESHVMFGSVKAINTIFVSDKEIRTVVPFEITDKSIEPMRGGSIQVIVGDSPQVSFTIIDLPQNPYAPGVVLSEAVAEIQNLFAQNADSIRANIIEMINGTTDAKTKDYLNALLEILPNINKYVAEDLQRTVNLYDATKINLLERILINTKSAIEQINLQGSNRSSLLFKSLSSSSSLTDTDLLLTNRAYFLQRTTLLWYLGMFAEACSLIKPIAPELAVMAICLHLVEHIVETYVETKYGRITSFNIKCSNGAKDQVGNSIFVQLLDSPTDQYQLTARIKVARLINPSKTLAWPLLQIAVYTPLSVINENINTLAGILLPLLKLTTEVMESANGHNGYPLSQLTEYDVGFYNVNARPSLAIGALNINGQNGIVYIDPNNSDPTKISIDFGLSKNLMSIKERLINYRSAGDLEQNIQFYMPPVLVVSSSNFIFKLDKFGNTYPQDLGITYKFDSPYLIDQSIWRSIFYVEAVDPVDVPAGAVKLDPSRIKFSAKEFDNPTSQSISIDTSNLGTGTYVGCIAVSMPGGTREPLFIPVTVFTEGKIFTVKLSQNVVRLSYGAGGAQLTATAYDASGQIVPTSSSDYAWESFDPSHVQIDQAGNISIVSYNFVDSVYVVAALKNNQTIRSAADVSVRVWLEYLDIDALVNTDVPVSLQINVTYTGSDLSHNIDTGFNGIVNEYNPYYPFLHYKFVLLCNTKYHVNVSWTCDNCISGSYFVPIRTGYYYHNKDYLNYYPNSIAPISYSYDITTPDCPNPTNDFCEFCQWIY